MSKKRYPHTPGDGHTHWWLIPGPPAKPIGTCRLCGTQRKFVNTPTKMGMHRTPPAPRDEAATAP